MLAKQRGVYRGRKKALADDQAIELRRRVSAGEQKATLARELGISRETLYQYLKVVAPPLNPVFRSTAQIPPSCGPRGLSHHRRQLDRRHGPAWFKPGLQSGVNFPALERYCRSGAGGSIPVSQLALQHGVSRKFVYQQKNMASAALDEVFASSVPDDDVLFELPVTNTWLRQLTLGVTLIGHGSYRGGVELMRDLLGVRISEGTIHNVHPSIKRRRGRPAA